MKGALVVIPLVALGIGFGAGVGFEHWRQRPVNDLLQRMPITHTAANAGKSVAVLELLRGGETDRALSMLETYLDGDLMVMGDLYRSATQKQRDEAWAGAVIRRAREYRKAHPHTPNPAIAREVSETLSIPIP